MSDKPEREKKKRSRNSVHKIKYALIAGMSVLVLAVAAIIYIALDAKNGTPDVAWGDVQMSASTGAPAEPSEATVPTETTEPPQITETTAEPTTEAPEPSRTPEEEKALEMLSGMTLEEKVYQLFLVTPRTLTGFYGVDIAGPATQEALQNYPVGGIVYFSENIYSEGQISDMIRLSQEYARYPMFICVDEEGGRVSRLSSIGVTDVLDPMATYGAQGDTGSVREIGQTLGTQLGSVGFNVDFAPVADVVTNPNNTEIGDRSFSSDPQVAADMVTAMVGGLQSSGTISCLKHFPGHGSTEADSHNGLSVTGRTLDELRQTELIPFRAGIEAGADMVMISHMSVPAITGDNTPCDLSPAIVTDLLRKELGFTGVIVTDSHEMGAITNYYNCGEAAVMAITAGCDIVLMPYDLGEAAEAVITAIENGKLTEARINESVLRILTLKYRYGILE